MPPPRVAFKSLRREDQRHIGDNKSTVNNEAQTPDDTPWADDRRLKKKQREYEVFIGGLDRDTTEMDLVEVFGAVGDVVEVRLVRRSFPPYSKSFAFVRFATVDQAKRAASELRYVQVRGRSCGVTRSNDNETLHVGNICTSWTKEDLLQVLNVFELENLEDVHLVKDTSDKRKNRGYAFLDFSTHLDALAACCKLHKEELFLGTDVRADISFSRLVEPNEEIMSKVRSVFLDGLPPSWDAERLRSHFGQFGEIENVQLASDMPMAKRKDFGFIDFKTREAALNCIEKINKNGIDEGNEKIVVKAMLKKPLQKKYIPTSAIRRGYMTKEYARSTSQRSHEDAHFYTIRSRRSNELNFKQYNAKIRDLSLSRGGGYSYASASYRENFESKPRRYYPRELHDPYSRSRGEYKGSSSRNLAFERYMDFPPSHKQLPVSYSYASDSDDEVYFIYEDDYSPNESREFVYDDHPTYSGQKRHYPDISDDVLVTSSMLERNSRPDYELNDYSPREVSKYAKYSRIIPENHVIYERVKYASRSSGTRYLSPRAASRFYH